CVESDGCDKVLEIYEKMVKISLKSLPSTHVLATTYNNIQTVYDEKGEYDKAFWCYNISAFI
ncbi:unnamed protein product, partial [Didymodactylos carnosus]